MDEIQKMRRELRVHRSVMILGAIALCVAANSPRQSLIDAEEIHADKIVVKQIEAQNSIANRFYALDTNKTIRGFFGVDDKMARPAGEGATDTTALVLFDEEGIGHAQLYARHDVAALHLMRGDTRYALPVITLQVNRKSAQGDWIELINSRRQILSKLQNETATFEVKDTLDHSQIGFAIEKIGHPKTISVDKK